MFVTVQTWRPRPRPDCHGWHKITPAASHWLGLALSGACLAFMSWVVVRLPATGSLEGLWAIYLLFALALLATGVAAYRIGQIRRPNIEWLGGQMAFNDHTGEGRFCLMIHVATMRHRWNGELRISFDDGTTLKIEPQAMGVDDLCRAIARAHQDHFAPPEVRTSVSERVAY